MFNGNTEGTLGEVVRNKPGVIDRGQIIVGPDGVWILSVLRILCA